jgi:CO/xanthine dehydrogenase FAD-binding subunit
MRDPDETQHRRADVAHAVGEQPQKRQEDRHPFQRVHLHPEDAIEIGTTGHRRRPHTELPPATHFRAYKTTKRIDEDISAVLAAFCLKVDGGRISDAKVAFGGMVGTPKRAKTVEENLRGLSLGDARGWQLAADAVKKDFTPLIDLRASTSHRRRVAGNLLIKGLAEIAGISSDVTRIADHRMVADAAE